jgi:hypothetical protein
MIRLTKKQTDPGYSGAIAKTVVLKQYAHQTVITAYPDMSGIKPSPKQKAGRSDFAEAVAYARGINNDPVKKAAYAAALDTRRSVYHAALSEYLTRIRRRPG